MGSQAISLFSAMLLQVREKRSQPLYSYTPKQYKQGDEAVSLYHTIERPSG